MIFKRSSLPFRTPSVGSLLFQNPRSQLYVQALNAFQMDIKGSHRSNALNKGKGLGIVIPTEQLHLQPLTKSIINADSFRSMYYILRNKCHYIFSLYSGKLLFCV